jgi:serine protease DegS
LSFREIPQVAALRRVLGFVTRFAIVGLALAFLILLWKPELLRPQRALALTPSSAAMPSNLPASFAIAVSRSAPAVVSVYTQRVVPNRPSQLQDLLGDTWPGIGTRIESSLGSGVIIDTQGHIVTNDHVVQKADAIAVQLADNRTAVANVVGRDPDTDLAVLKIDLEGLPTMPLGRSDTLNVGDVVLAIGNPVGVGQTVTHGIVSGKGRGLQLATFEDFIQTDAAINAGNSGGALVNVDGELVGINTAVFSRTAGIEGIGFAIPVNLVRGVLSEILKNGRVVRGWLGVIPNDLTPEYAQALGVPVGRGVVVINMFTDGPAFQAGLRPGDVITQIDDTMLTTAHQALIKVATLTPGKTVRVRAIRRGQSFERTMKVVERPNK